MNLKTSSELLLDSLVGQLRVTCFRVTYPRIVHSEFVRHRAGSYCSSSSRAVPLNRLIKQYVGFVPDSWRKHQPGMQPIEGENLFTETELVTFNCLYQNVKNASLDTAERLHNGGSGVAKEQVNRLLEPYSYVTHLVQMSSAGYENFFKLRTVSSAQYELRKLALLMKEQYSNSTPVRRTVHLPFYESIKLESSDLQLDQLQKYLSCSSARCARTSYYNHSGKEPTLEEDYSLSEKLVSDQHWSPFEFPVLEQKVARHFFPNLQWYEVLPPERTLQNSQNVQVLRDLSGNLGHYSVVQYRKLLELTTATT